MSLDAYVEQVAKRAAEEVGARILAELPGVVRAELERREGDRLLNSSQAAQFFGKSYKAFARWLNRGGRDVAALARVVGGRKAWLRSDLQAYLSRTR